MTYFEVTNRQFEQIDAYVAEVVRDIADAQPSDRLVDKIVTRVRGDGYPRFADALAEVTRRRG